MKRLKNYHWLGGYQNEFHVLYFLLEDMPFDIPDDIYKWEIIVSDNGIFEDSRYIKALIKGMIKFCKQTKNRVLPLSIQQKIHFFEKIAAIYFWFKETNRYFFHFKSLRLKDLPHTVFFEEIDNDTYYQVKSFLKNINIMHFFDGQFKPEKRLNYPESLFIRDLSKFFVIKYISSSYIMFAYKKHNDLANIIQMVQENPDKKFEMRFTPQEMEYFYEHHRTEFNILSQLNVVMYDLI